MMDDEELAQLREELQAATDGLARARLEAAGSDARARDAAGENECLRAELAAATDAAASLDADIVALREDIDRHDADLRAAAARYRELILESDPLLTPELIAGETIEEVEASARRARDVALRVRTQIERETQAARVPAGAPARRGIDVGAMTPEQKIRYGLAQRERSSQ
jgi:hypothetical protein